MGIIRAVTSAVGGGFADQWLEVLEPYEMTDTTVFTSGVTVRNDDKRNRNRKGTNDTVSNGSIIHVYPNQFMMLLDGGKIVDYTAEQGYYKVDDSSLPSMFNGQIGDTLKESFNRVKFAGVTPTKQKVYYINLQEIKGIKFGTRNPVNYFDSFYNAELFLRAHGNYSIKITDPIRFFEEAIPKNKDIVDINDINEQFLSEFLEAFQAAINQMSADGERISFVPSKGRELSKYMANILDQEWNQLRGLEIQSVGIASISYDEKSTELINMRNEGAMMSDPSIASGYMQSHAARGIENAGKSEGGANSFIGLGMANMVGGGMVGASADAAKEQREGQQAREKTTDGWTCSKCGHKGNNGPFCTECGFPKNPENATWKCPKCGHGKNTGNFCSECGEKKPKEKSYRCNNCDTKLDINNLPKFCPECGDKVDEDDIE